jgi:hypothetical protein
VANGAVNVGRFSTYSTDYMVVIVTDSILIAGWRSSGLDASDETLLGQDFQGVVYRLSRNGTDFGTNITGDIFRSAVGATRYNSQHRQALGRDLNAVSAKNVIWIVTHGWIVGQIWTVSRIR